MKVMYIAGPLRADTAWEIEQNIRIAEELAYKVAHLGHMYFCPHTNARFGHGLLPVQFWLKGDLEVLRRCDAVVLCKNWRLSEGTLGEIDEANRLSIPVYASIESLVQESPSFIDAPVWSAFLKKQEKENVCEACGQKEGEGRLKRGGSFCPRCGRHYPYPKRKKE